MTGIIESIALFIEDLLGCDSLETEEEVTKCRARAKKYATWSIFLAILALFLFIAPKAYRWYKGTKK